MSKDYNHEIGYETLQKDFEVYKKQVPKGVTLVKGGNNIYLQFKTPNKSRSKYKCNCTFSIDGMIDAVRKAGKVKEKLSTLDSEAQFWEWYKKEIEQESQLADDVLTFGEAIKKVEDDFWGRPNRRKEPRDKNNPSHVQSWNITYGDFYKRLPQKNRVSLKDISKTLGTWRKGTKAYIGAVSAMKKLVRITKSRDIILALEDVDCTQTEFAELQTINLEQFLEWRNNTLGINKTLHTNARLGVRKAWLWVFSMQIIYALRISEVFAIKNLFEPYLTKDGVSIPALNDLDNTDNLIYIGEKTNLGTTVKTGSRIARPNVPPRYPNLIETLDIKNPLIPSNKPRSKNPGTLSKFYAKEARKKLVKWNAPFTQTHADRHLGNINGMQAGIPLEVRAQSMGHTPAMNDSVYKKRQSTQTTIDLLLNSNQNAIDFVTALTSIKNLVKTQPEQKQFAAKILSIIYQKSEDEIVELL